MPAWPHFTKKELADLLRFLKSWKTVVSGFVPVKTGTGDAENGAELFYYLCSRCHGKNGNGGIGTAVLNPDFLAAASDNFLASAIAGGRKNTPMFGWHRDLGGKERLQHQDLRDIVAFMRGMEHRIEEYIDPGADLGNAEQGKKLYRRFCSECHGEKGEGPKAPALHNDEFLNAASHGYLLATITLGRENTPMPAWGQDSEKRKKLTARQRWDIVSFIRKWQKVRIKKSWVNAEN